MKTFDDTWLSYPTALKSRRDLPMPEVSENGVPSADENIILSSVVKLFNNHRCGLEHFFEQSRGDRNDGCSECARGLMVRDQNCDIGAVTFRAGAIHHLPLPSPARTAPMVSS